MAPRTYQFPDIQIEARQGGLGLVLRHALHIDIPDSLHEMALDEELVRATEVEGLWIERVGCSRIVVTLANHQGVLFPADMATVAMWIQQHTAWSRLGLRLVWSDRGRTEELAFSIQHPDLMSVLVAPEGALVAELLQVTCRLDMSMSTTGYGAQALAESVEEDPCRNLDPEDKASLDNFIIMLGGLTRVTPGTVERKRKRARTTGPVPDIQASRGIIEAALDILLFGGGKRCTGFRMASGTAPPGLTRLAPGVFNIPHLKEIACRARHVPTIATCLSRMAKAESPSLRRKTAALSGPSTRESASIDYEKVVSGIEKAVWDVLQRNTRVPTLKPRSSTKPPSVRTRDGPRAMAEAYIEEPILSFGDTPQAAELQEPPRTLEIWDVEAPSPTRVATPSLVPVSSGALTQNGPYPSPDGSHSTLLHGNPRNRIVLPSILSPPAPPAVDYDAEEPHRAVYLCQANVGFESFDNLWENVS